MVYVEDLGTPLEIPFDQLEPFLDSPEHEAAHRDDVRNFVVVENAGPKVVVTYERKFDGEWGKSSTRMFSFPPHCVCVEELEGVFAGSRFVGIRRPESGGTRIDLFGDIQCKLRTPEETRTLWLAILAKSHQADVAALGKYRARV